MSMDYSPAWQQVRRMENDLRAMQSTYASLLRKYPKAGAAFAGAIFALKILADLLQRMERNGQWPPPPPGGF